MYVCVCMYVCNLSTGSGTHLCILQTSGSQHSFMPYLTTATLVRLTSYFTSTFNCRFFAPHPSRFDISTWQLSLSRSHSHAAVVCHILCSKSPFPNAFGARIPVPSKLNLPLWKSALDNYSDHVVADFSHLRLAHQLPL